MVLEGEVFPKDIHCMDIIIISSSSTSSISSRSSTSSISSSNDSSSNSSGIDDASDASTSPLFRQNSYAVQMGAPSRRVRGPKVDRSLACDWKRTDWDAHVLGKLREGSWHEYYHMPVEKFYVLHSMIFSESDIAGLHIFWITWPIQCGNHVLLITITPFSIAERLLI